MYSRFGIRTRAILRSKAALAAIAVAASVGIGGIALAGGAEAAVAIPVPHDDAYTTPAATTLSIAAPGILANDIDAAGLFPTVTSGVSHGTLDTSSGDGGFLYTPTGAFNGTDSFTYCLSVVANTLPCVTSGGAILTATVTITVVPPVAHDDSYSTPRSTELNVASPGILVNDTQLTPAYRVTVTSDPSHGSLVLGPTKGAFHYDPTGAFVGTDSYQYCITALANTLPCLSNVATVTIDVTRVINSQSPSSPPSSPSTVTSSSPSRGGSSSPSRGTPTRSSAPSTPSTSGGGATGGNGGSSGPGSGGGELANTGSALVAPATSLGVLALILGVLLLFGGTYRRRRQH